jgi:hypothetical protein
MKSEKRNLPVKWDEEMAREAELAAAMENSVVTGQFFSLRNGQLTWNDAPLPNNMMAVIILDAIMENVYYAGKFEPDSPQSPTCFAFGRDEQTMTPHKVVVDAGTAQCDLCKNCRWNEWASADTGRGKACRNTRRLAMIAAGNFDHQGKLVFFDVEDYENTALGFMKLPVTSVKGYAGYVKNLAGGLHRPPHYVATKIRVVADAKTQFKVVFEPLITLPNEMLGIMKKRHQEAQSLIAFPYTPIEELPPSASKQQRAPQNKVKRGRY